MKEAPHIPETMQAIAINDGRLVVERRPVPVPQRGEVLIKVTAAGVNRPDLLQRQGRYPPPPGVTDIPGLEVAGRVIATGPSVPGARVGFDVVALLSGGGYAEYAVTSAQQCLSMPKNLGPIAAAGIPETFFTVWSNMVMRGKLEYGQRILIHGGASGIGTTAIQMAQALGAIVYTTAGNDDKCRAAEKLGAVRAINYKTEDFAAIIMKETRDKGVDMILDIVGASYMKQHLDILAPDGKLITIAVQGGAKAEIDLFKIMSKRLTLTGTTLRPQAAAAKAAIAKDLKRRVWPMIQRQKILPVIDRVFPLHDAQAAHDYLEAGQHFGKVILKI